MNRTYELVCVCGESLDAWPNMALCPDCLRAGVADAMCATHYTVVFPRNTAVDTRTVTR